MMSHHPEFPRFAVAVIILRRNEDVEGGWECALVARKDDHTQWGLPGGKVDAGELSPEAAHRELYEETGIYLGHRLHQRGHEPILTRLLPQGTMLDRDGYLTTFYLVDTTGLDLPEELSGVGEGEAPAKWGPFSELLEGPYAKENALRLRQIGVLP